MTAACRVIGYMQEFILNTHTPFRIKHKWKVADSPVCCLLFVLNRWFNLPNINCQFKEVDSYIADCVNDITKLEEAFTYLGAEEIPYEEFTRGMNKAGDNVRYSEVPHIIEIRRRYDFLDMNTDMIFKSRRIQKKITKADEKAMLESVTYGRELKEELARSSRKPGEAFFLLMKLIPWWIALRVAMVVRPSIPSCRKWKITRMIPLLFSLAMRKR